MVPTRIRRGISKVSPEFGNNLIGMKKNNDNREQIVRKSLESEFQLTLNQRVQRKLEIDHQGIIGAHHFSEASSECINLYRDGYFIAAVMMTHAINEALMKFIADKNIIKIESDWKKQWHSKLMKIFLDKNILTKQSIDASIRIWESYRNDIHHMNPAVSGIKFPELAKSNLQDLSIIEKEIFGATSKKRSTYPNSTKILGFNKRRNGFCLFKIELTLILVKIGTHPIF